MKRVAGLLLVIFMLMACSQNALALKPSVELRPADPAVISKDASFILIVDPKTSEKPVRITWSVYDTGNIGIGSLPMVGGKGVCYFSDDDENATCGPSPFTKAGPTELYVYVITPGGVENITEAMNISAITFETEEVYREGNTIYMVFYTPLYDSFTYEIYHDDFTFFTEGVLERTTYGSYVGNKTINPGVYYFAFYAENGGTYGTNLKRVIIPSGDYLTAETTKESYWSGEKAKITGTTNAEEVSGRINFPNGTKAKEFEITMTGDSFSYEFRIPSLWPEGKYNLTFSKPLTQSLTFSVANLIEVTPKRVSEKINKSDDFNKTVTLKNLGSNTTNLSITVSGDLESSQVILGSSSLEEGKSTTLTIGITDVQANLAGTITVKTDLGIELEIPVSVITEEAEEECPSCPACPVCPSDGVSKGLEIIPKIWSQNCITGNEITQTLVLKNTGNYLLDSFTFDVDDVYSDNSLSDLKATGDMDVSLSGVTIEPDQSESVAIEVTPYNEGSYKGIVTIKSGGSGAYMLVSLDCFEDMTSEISLLRGELDASGVSLDSGVYSDIDYLLVNAQDAYDVGNYPEAKSNLEQASAKIGMFGEAGTVLGEGMDLTIPIIVVVVVIVAAGLLYYFKFHRKGEELESEEEFEEEF